MSENQDVHSTEEEAEEEVWRSRGKQSSALPQSTVLPSADDDEHTRTLAGTMAEHVYSKGTRVWFVDKEQAWIRGGHSGHQGRRRCHYAHIGGRAWQGEQPRKESVSQSRS
jgi:hypothetical protein